VGCHVVERNLPNRRNVVGLISGAEGLTMLLLPQLLKLLDVSFAPFAMCSRQLLSDILLEFFFSRAALDLLQAKMMLSVDLAERALNLPHHCLEFR
jgi:hypothetical protein